MWGVAPAPVAVLPTLVAGAVGLVGAGFVTTGEAVVGIVRTRSFTVASRRRPLSSSGRRVLSRVSSAPSGPPSSETYMSKITDVDVVNAAARAMLHGRGELAEFLMREVVRRREEATVKVVAIRPRRPDTA